MMPFLFYPWLCLKLGQLYQWAGGMAMRQAEAWLTRATVAMDRISQSR
jgi:hypothetical protein